MTPFREGGPGYTPQEADSKKPLEISKEEYDVLRNPDDESEGTTEIKNRLGIRPDSGPVEVDVEGDKFWITTKEGDFGTRIDTDEGVERAKEAHSSVS